MSETTSTTSVAVKTPMIVELIIGVMVLLADRSEV